MVSVKISNATQNAIKINYAIVETYGDKKFRKVLSVLVAPRALLQDVSFPNDEYYNAFLSQIQSLLDSGKIVIGNYAKASALENASENITKAEKATTRAKKNKVVENLENSTTGKKTKLKISVEES